MIVTHLKHIINQYLKHNTLNHLINILKHNLIKNKNHDHKNKIVKRKGHIQNKEKIDYINRCF